MGTSDGVATADAADESRFQRAVRIESGERGTGTGGLSILQEAGSGQHTKMCNQIAIASNMIGVCEAVAYAKKAGLNPDKVLESISTGAAGSWSLSNLAPRMLKGDFEPGFYVKHFMKDMKIALDEAEKLQLPVPGLSLAKELYEELIMDGEENSGTQVLYKKYIRG